MLETKDLLQETANQSIVLQGPKGVGKSFALVGLMAEYSSLQKR